MKGQRVKDQKVCGLPRDISGAFVLGHGEDNDAVPRHPEEEGEGMSHHDGHEAWVSLVGFPHLHGVVERYAIPLVGGDVF